MLQLGHVILIRGNVFLRLFDCLAIINQTDTLLLFNPSNTSFGYNSIFTKKRSYLSSRRFIPWAARWKLDSSFAQITGQVSSSATPSGRANGVEVTSAFCSTMPPPSRPMQAFS